MSDLSIKDIEFIKFYEGANGEGCYGNYFWEYVPNFDISLMGDCKEWIDWLEEESKMFIEEFEYDRYGEIEKWWLKTPEKEPIIVV